MEQILISINEIIIKLQLKTNFKKYNCDDEINKGKYIYFAIYNKKLFILVNLKILKKD